MKKFYYIIIFFVIFSCANNKVVYWCGDHPCINKKEREAYFKKTMVVEAKNINKKKLTNNSDIERIILQTRTNEKKRINKEKELTKQVKLEEKRRIKEEKELTKQINLNKKNIIKKKNKTPKQIVNAGDDPIYEEMSSSKFLRLVEKITNKNLLRPYPDINNIPD